MSRSGRPLNTDAQRIMPHDQDRRNGQPHTREIEEYSGGLVQPPKQKTGKRTAVEVVIPQPPRVRSFATRALR